MLYGAVLTPVEESDHALARMNDVVFDDPRVHNLLLPVRDGVMIAQKIADESFTENCCEAS